MKHLVMFFMIFCTTQLVSANDAEEKGPCKQDMEKLCPGIKAGGGAIRECLKKNKDQLSAECKEKMEKRKEKRDELHAACKSEAESFCKDVEKGDGRVIKCLKEKSSESGFGAECKKSLDEMPHRNRKK